MLQVVGMNDLLVAHLALIFITSLKRAVASVGD